MKKILFVISFVVLMFTAFGQKANVIKLLPLSLHYNSIGFEWEHQEGRSSIIVGVGLPYESSIMDRKYKSFHINPNDYYFASLHTYSIKLGYRYYLKDGIYAEGLVNSSSLHWQSLMKNKTTISGKLDGYFYSVGFGGKLGYQKVFKCGLVIDTYAGINLNRVNGNSMLNSSTLIGSEYTKKFVNNLIDTYLPNNAKVINYSDNGITHYKLNTFTYPLFYPGVSIGYRF
jgi:hypothetical protein